MTGLLVSHTIQLVRGEYKSMVNTHDCIFINLVIKYVTLNHFSDVVSSFKQRAFYWFITYIVYCAYES